MYIHQCVYIKQNMTQYKIIMLHVLGTAIIIFPRYSRNIACLRQIFPRLHLDYRRITASWFPLFPLSQQEPKRRRVSSRRDEDVPLCPDERRSCTPKLRVNTLACRDRLLDIFTSFCQDLPPLWITLSRIRDIWLQRIGFPLFSTFRLFDIAFKTIRFVFHSILCEISRR